MPNWSKTWGAMILVSFLAAIYTLAALYALAPAHGEVIHKQVIYGDHDGGRSGPRIVTERPTRERSDDHGNPAKKIQIERGSVGGRSR